MTYLGETLDEGVEAMETIDCAYTSSCMEAKVGLKRGQGGSQYMQRMAIFLVSVKTCFC